LMRAVGRSAAERSRWFSLGNRFMSQAVLVESDPIIDGSAQAFQDSLQATFDDVRSAVWVTDLDGRSVYTNRTAARLLREKNGDAKVDDVLPEVGAMLAEVRDEARPVSMQAHVAGSDYDAVLSPLCTHTGRQIAALVTLSPRESD